MLKMEMDALVCFWFSFRVNSKASNNALNIMQSQLCHVLRD